MVNKTLLVFLLSEVFSQDDIKQQLGTKILKLLSLSSHNVFLIQHI